ncbi:MAG: hypothetical protein QNK23_06850 [Crocinitomicaceae bacterium]|nr:hypothetical protein [Crocinitomicaceae bacterium]
MKKRLLILLLIYSPLQLIAQYPSDFEPILYQQEYFDYHSDITVHFKVSNGVQELRYSHEKYGMLNWLETSHSVQNKIVRVEYTDTLGVLKNKVVSGAPIIKYEYDAQGNKSRVSYWSSEEVSTNYEALEFHATTYTYDAQNRVTSSVVYSTNNIPICSFKLTYTDNYKKPSKVSYVREDGNLINSEIAAVDLIYDKRGRIIKTTFTNNTESSRFGGVHSIKIKYKKRKPKMFGQVADSFKVIRFYDENGRQIDIMNSIDFAKPIPHGHLYIDWFLNPKLLTHAF